MSFILSPNMTLPIPTVGQELGPQFAFDINTSLSLIDSHDHSPGRGVQITPAGMNINTQLDFKGNPALNLAYASFTAQSMAVSTIQAISVAPASSINELWYTDSNGTQTQITKNGQVNVIASSIPGESYSSGTFIWTQTQSALPTTPANFDIGSITLRPNIAATTFGVTLSPPSSISSAYTINLPQLPLANSFMAINSSGAISTPVATNGTNGQYLATVSGNPTWTSFIVPTQQVFTSPNTYTFTVPALGTQTNAGAIYTNNGFFYTVTTTALVGATSLICTGNGAPTSSGTLTYYTGSTGQASISFTSVVASTTTYTTPAGCIAIKIRMIGGGGGGGASGTSGIAHPGIAGGDTVFGSYTAAGGGGGLLGTSTFGTGGGGTPNANSGSPTVSILGGCGQSCVQILFNNSTTSSSGGAGGNGAFGGGGSGGYAFPAGTDAGVSGAVNSGGGGGGACGETNVLYGGGGGASGSYVEQLIQSPSATYIVSVGVGGVQGAKGNGEAGGTGGSGIIIVDEYYP